MPEHHSKGRGKAQMWLAAFMEEPGEGCRTDWPFFCIVSAGTSYPAISINRRPTTVSRLVCERFHGPPPSEDSVVRHGACHDTMCIQPAHLRWGSQFDNAVDMIRDGTWRQSLTGAAKLTEDQVLEIVRLIDSGSTPRDIAARYVVNQKAIERIRSGRNWNWLTNRRPPQTAFHEALIEAGS